MASLLGGCIPVPLQGLLSSVQVLHPADLALVVGDAWRYACTPPSEQAAVIHPAWRSPPSGQEPALESALLCYGLMACREVEHRYGKPQPAGGNVRKQDLRVALRAAERILEELRERHPAAVKVWAQIEGRIPHVQLQWLAPSWLGVPELHARHRTFLLGTRNGSYYLQHGWRAQGTFQMCAPGLDLPASTQDASALLTRWRADTRKDWGERLTEAPYTRKGNLRKK